MPFSAQTLGLLVPFLLLGGCGRFGFSALETRAGEDAGDAPSQDAASSLPPDGAVDAGEPTQAPPDAGPTELDGGDLDGAILDAETDAGMRLDAGADTGAPDAGFCGPMDDLVLALAFNEGTGTTAADTSGNGNDGTLMGFDVSGWVTGVAGTALNFDGVNDVVDARSDASLDNLTTFTTCAWIFPEGYPNEFPTIADKSGDAFIGGWNFYIENDASFGLLTNRRQLATSASGSVILNSWQHVCASWDGTDGSGGIELYFNGSATPRASTDSNGTGNDSDAARDLLIGRSANNVFPFDGSIDGFRLYGRVLSEAEVSAIYDCVGP